MALGLRPPGSRAGTAALIASEASSHVPLVRSKLPEVSFAFALSYPRKQQPLRPAPTPQQTPAAETHRPLALVDDFATESNSPSSKLPPTVLPPWTRQDQALPRDKLKLLIR